MHVQQNQFKDDLNRSVQYSNTSISYKIKNSNVLWYKINYEIKWSQLCFGQPIELNDEGIDKIKIKII